MSIAYAPSGEAERGWLLDCMGLFARTAISR
jgi:hypothetical protein